MARQKSAAASALALGVELAAHAAGGKSPQSCKRCAASYESQLSSAVCPNVFCSKECEQEFVRESLKHLTLDDCLRLQQRLDQLLKLAEAPFKINKA